MNLFEMVIKSTKVLLKPKNLLSTYNQTKIRYHIVTEPSYKEILVGRASVRAVFNLGRRTRVAGMYVNDGRITRESTIHVMRGGEEIFVGEVSTLKHFKNDVREVATGLEGGVTVEGFNEFEEDDVLEAYVSEEV